MLATHDDPYQVENGLVAEELWSLKVVMAKTGLSRSTLYAYIAAGARRLGKRRVAWFASEVRNWITSWPAASMGTAT